jgi:hypothetical protein
LQGCDLASLRGRLQPDRQLHDVPNFHFLGIRDLVEHDLLERSERTLGIGTREIGALGDGVGELSLSEGHSSPESVDESPD